VVDSMEVGGRALKQKNELWLSEDQLCMRRSMRVSLPASLMTCLKSESLPSKSILEWQADSASRGLCISAFGLFWRIRLAGVMGSVLREDFDGCCSVRRFLVSAGLCNKPFSSGIAGIVYGPLQVSKPLLIIRIAVHLRRLNIWRRVLSSRRLCRANPKLTANLNPTDGAPNVNVDSIHTPLPCPLFFF